MHLRIILVATSLVFAFVNVSRAQLGKCEYSDVSNSVSLFVANLFLTKNWILIYICLSEENQ